VLLEPLATALERKFRARLRPWRLDVRQERALCALTIGSICRLLAGGAPIARIFEEMEYQGRRLAKLDLKPEAILAALLEYDKVLTAALRGLPPPQRANFQWVQEHLHFCTVLILNRAYYQVRDREAQTFYALGRCELEARDLDQLLQGTAETLKQYAAAAAVRIYLRAAEEGLCEVKAVAGEVGNSQRRKVRADFSAEASDCVIALAAQWRKKYRRVWRIPLALGGGRAEGAIEFGFDKDYEWLPRERDLLSSAAERCLAAAQRASMIKDLAVQRDQIRALAERLLNAEEAERRRIGRELHDGTGQALLCIRLQLELLERELPPVMAVYQDRIHEVRRLSEQTVVEIRRVIAALSPEVLEKLGLGKAVRQLAARLGNSCSCAVHLRLARLRPVAPETAKVVYRLLQECCNNIAKHSQAKNVNVSLETADGIVRLLVEDDGIGFDVQQALAKTGAFGLSGIRERVTVLGGSCSLSSVRAGLDQGRRSGSTVRIELPLPGKRRRGAGGGEI
jgi:signal transduction histidine kinase